MLKPLGILLLTGCLFAQSPDKVEFFEKKIRPIFATKCQACHGAKNPMAGLNLSTLATFEKGSDKGPIVKSGDPEHSRLIEVTSYEAAVKMPPTGKLSSEELRDLKAWVEIGAPWPVGDSRPKVESAKMAKGFTAEQKAYWAFQPVKDYAPPAVRHESWVKSPVDRFILAKLEANGINPPEPAPKLALLRRVTFDLTGLPPTPKEIAAFLADASSEAFARVVDRLLASPQYGEKWGRHWLDIARYADSTGMDEDHPYPYAWRYRDYVIDAFNRDEPYSRFTMEQLAGDLLPAKTPEERNHNLIATGFLALGPKPLAQQDRRKMIYDVVDEQIDVTSKVFMGLTVACSRCHDHKFDPILTKDYYSLASIFAGTKSFRNLGRPSSVAYLYYAPLDREAYERREAHREAMYAKQMEMEQVLAEEKARAYLQLRPRLGDYMMAAWSVEHEGASSPELARKKGLDPVILEKWIRYLKPASLPKPFLQKWRDADRSSIARIARDYQAAYLVTAQRWDARMADWRRDYQEEVKQDRDLPARPKPDVPEREFAATLKEKDPFFVETSFGDGPFALEESLKVKSLRQEWKRFEETLPQEPAMASAVTDEETPVRQTVFVRGDHNSPGEPVEKAFPAILTHERQPLIDRGSGRLELATWLTSPDQPLTVRVMVNRIWQWHFGEGLVRTPSNWGRMGEPPTHPELLDFLARRFMESGWSMKAMHRLILLSSTYQMSSQCPAEVRRNDPMNRLWSRFNRRRLDIEEIRDSFLALDGSLDLTLGGSLMETARPMEAGDKTKRRRNAVNADEVRRRTLYLPLRRGSMPTVLSIFDFGDATASNEARSRTNVAPQALFMLNSTFISERSIGFAKQLLKDPIHTDTDRIERAFLMVLTRRPTMSEIDQALTYMNVLRAKLASPEARLYAWQSYCRILMASNEFAYID